ncbi:MAG: DUF1730 domain-containing protein [Phycisphaeraceae bacterium]|nr:DUF1730 domain-containing protein [Phycisphaeraceae bacterium]
MAATIERLARAEGFALAGVAPAQPANREEFFRHWLQTGQHGEMAYLANHLEVRLDPKRFLPGAKSILCFADRYAEKEGVRSWELGVREDKTPAPGPQTPSPRGRVARYAWGDDYHVVMKKRLFKLADAMRAHWPNETFRAAVDTAPLLEREHAARAGLGWIGKHTLLIHPQLGSWLLLGEIVTTLEIRNRAGDCVAGPGSQSPALPPRHDQKTGKTSSHCGSCTRCLDACPTSCIEPYRLNASRCVSYLTLEHRSLIDPAFFPQMGAWIAGCDICQEVCPFNNPLRLPDSPPPHPRYKPRDLAAGLDLLEVLNWSAADRQTHFRGSTLKRMKLEMVQRNALIAAGNDLAQHDHPALRAKVRDLATDDNAHPLVRDTARQVLIRLGQG